MKYVHHPRQISCTPLMTLLMVLFTSGKSKLNVKNLTACVSFYVGCVYGVQCACSLMVTILHIETFVAFEYDLSLILRLISDSDLDQINQFSDINW